MGSKGIVAVCVSMRRHRLRQKGMDLGLLLLPFLSTINLFEIISCHHDIINIYNENYSITWVMFDEHNVVFITLFTPEIA
jgi:hypothetical protein